VERRAPGRRPWWWRAVFSEEVSAPPTTAFEGFLQGLVELAGHDPQSPQLLFRLPHVTQGFR
jgi:hypothetical protein